MKTSFINFLLKNSIYALGIFSVFAFLSYSYRPNIFIKNIGLINGIIESVEYKTEATWARTAGSKGYSKFFEIGFKGDKGKKYRRYSQEEIKKIEEYGINNLLNHQAIIRYFEDKKYMVILDLVVDDRKIIETKETGFMPFLIFVLLSLITLFWTVWGLYILELAPDDVRIKYLKHK